MDSLKLQIRDILAGIDEKDMTSADRQIWKIVNAKEIDWHRDVAILCGVCGKEALSVDLDPSREISEWDKANNSPRKQVLSCCARIWMIDPKEVEGWNDLTECVGNDMGPFAVD